MKCSEVRDIKAKAIPLRYRNEAGEMRAQLWTHVTVISWVSGTRPENQELVAESGMDRDPWMAAYQAAHRARTKVLRLTRVERRRTRRREMLP